MRLNGQRPELLKLIAQEPTLRRAIKDQIHEIKQVHFAQSPLPKCEGCGCEVFNSATLPEIDTYSDDCHHCSERLRKKLNRA